MPDLRPISRDAIPRSLEKAERYRLLNEPREAESICRDILRAEPGLQEAVVLLLLSLTDQFGHAYRVSVNHAQELLPQIRDEYRRTYYAGVIFERWAKAQLDERVPGYVVYDWMKQAMDHFEQAAELAPEGNEDAVLRWNTCARMIKRNDQVRPRPEDAATDRTFQDDVPIG